MIVELIVILIAMVVIFFAVVIFADQYLFPMLEARSERKAKAKERISTDDPEE